MKQEFPFRECRNLLLLLLVISAVGGAQIFRCRNLLLEIASKTLYIGVVDQLTYLFLHEESLYRQRQER